MSFETTIETALHVFNIKFMRYINMTSYLQSESESLKWSWDKHESEMLDSYLVQNQEDPRINCQSILTRAFIADILWPDEFDELISDELRFGAALSWVIQRIESDINRDNLMEDIAELSQGLPKFLFDTCSWLESTDCNIPNYVIDALVNVNPDQPGQLLGNDALNTFQHLWEAMLSRRDGPKLSVMEAACGSANDYRFIDSCGLSNFIDYTGFDVSDKNIENALQRFPETSFHVASVFDSGFPDNHSDYLFVHDLFEHLSPDGLDAAIKEVMRLCKKEAWLHFFNLYDIDTHEFHPVDSYYWNKLSIDEIVKTLEQYASNVEVIEIRQMLNTKFRHDKFHNDGAVTIIAVK